MEPDATSEMLMLRFQQGDLKAYVTLVNRHKKEICSFCYRMLHDYHAAEDVAQDVFISVYKSSSTYKSKAPFRAFLYSIARNACLTYLEKRKKVIPIGTSDERLTHENVDAPEDMAIRNDSSQRIQTALKKLTEIQRTALFLLHYGKFTYDEIAIVLRCPVGTVKSRISSAYSALKRELSKETDSRKAGDAVE